MTGGFFGKMFDLNRDGKMNPMERAIDFWVFDELTRKDVADYEEDDELEMMGLNYDELSYMDDDEMREVLEDAGLDPDDYDF